MCDSQFVLSLTKRSLNLVLYSISTPGFWKCSMLFCVCFVILVLLLFQPLPFFLAIPFPLDHSYLWYSKQRVSINRLKLLRGNAFRQPNFQSNPKLRYCLYYSLFKVYSIHPTTNSKREMKWSVRKFSNTNSPQLSYLHKKPRNYSRTSKTVNFSFKNCDIIVDGIFGNRKYYFYLKKLRTRRNLFIEKLSLFYFRH